MSDYMEYYEFYKKHWERSLSEKTSDMQKEIETLRAENARYREALERVCCAAEDHSVALSIAEDALKGEQA